jgi:hypothetical protein
MNYKKIDIFVDGKYTCTTTWHKTCKEAVMAYKIKHRTTGKVVANFA